LAPTDLLCTSSATLTQHLLLRDGVGRCGLLYGFSAAGRHGPFRAPDQQRQRGVCLVEAAIVTCRHEWASVEGKNTALHGQSSDLHLGHRYEGTATRPCDLHLLFGQFHVGPLILNRVAIRLQLRIIPDEASLGGARANQSTDRTE
jgi:hypothetical protein